MIAKHRVISIMILLMCFILLKETSFAQANSASTTVTDPNAVYVEFLGQSFAFLSFNYDRLLFRSNPDDNNIALRCGIGIGLPWYSIPVTVSYLSGRKHKLELGAGLVYAEGGFDVHEKSIIPTALIGYRFQKFQGGFVFRIGITPFYKDERIRLLAGLSLGYAF
jgi:hypothetical protein